MLYEYDAEKTILYYPTIKIRDCYWLRNAILYWDRVASIVRDLIIMNLIQ